MKARKVITSVLGIGLMGGIVYGYMMMKAQVSDLDKKQKKFRQYYAVLNAWLGRKLEEQDIAKLFLERGYQKIAIYGLGGIGQNLLKELKDSAVEVVCGIDNCGGSSDDMEVYLIDEEIPEVDAIVVTAMYDFDDIKSKLELSNSCDIVSLEELM